MSPSQRPTFADIPNNTNPKWWKDSSLRLNVFYTFGCMLCPFYLGYDQSLLTGLQALPQWLKYFGSPKGQWLGLISASILLPGIVMGYPASWICDKYGRRISVLLASVLIVAGAIWNGLATDVNQFIISRVLMGIGGAMTKTSAPALLQETVHPRLRSAMGTMYYGFYYLGSLTSAIMCIIGLRVTNNWGWRFPCMLAALGPLAVITILITAPESPRFLISKGKNDEALAIFAKYHANGDRDDKLVQWEFLEVQHALKAEAEENKVSYLDFFRTRGNQKRLAVSIAIALGVNWVGNGIVSYYLSPVLKSVGVTDPSKILGINAGLAAWNLIIAETAGLHADKIGRRPLFLTSTIGMILSYTFVMGFSAGFAQTHQSNLGLAAIPFLFFFFGFYDIAWTTMNYTYCAEIMPFNLRTKGLAIYLSVQQLGNAFNQFVNPIALDALKWKYYAVYIAIDCVFVVIIYLFFPETKKMSIEEIALVFDYGMKEGRKRAVDAFADEIEVAKSTHGSRKASVIDHIETKKSLES